MDHIRDLDALVQRVSQSERGLAAIDLGRALERLARALATQQTTPPVGGESQARVSSGQSSTTADQGPRRAKSERERVE